MAAVEHAVVSAGRLFPSRSAVQGPDLDVYGDYAISAAENGVSAERLLSSFDRGAPLLLSHLWSHAGLADQAELVDFSVWLRSQGPTVRATLLSSHSDRISGPGTALCERMAAAEALLNGLPPEREPPGLSQELLVSYWRTPRDSRTGVREVIARRLERDAGVLISSPERENEVFVLLSDSRTPSPPPSEKLSRLVCEVGSCHRDQPWVAVAEWAPSRGEVASLAERLRRAAEVAGASGRWWTLLAPGDVAPDSALLRGAERNSASLLAVLEPLGESPMLMETLAALYRRDLDRSATARDLHVVRRTLAYRVERIRALTGVDPLSTRGIQLFRTALCLSHMEDW